MIVGVLCLRPNWWCLVKVFTWLHCLTQKLDFYLCASEDEGNCFLRHILQFHSRFKLILNACSCVALIVCEVVVLLYSLLVPWKAIRDRAQQTSVQAGWLSVPPTMKHREMLFAHDCNLVYFFTVDTYATWSHRMERSMPRVPNYLLS